MAKCFFVIEAELIRRGEVYKPLKFYEILARSFFSISFNNPTVDKGAFVVPGLNPTIYFNLTASFNSWSLASWKM